MKKIILTFFIASFSIAQVDTTFYGLRGYEDQNGNTHLFYRMKSSYYYLRQSDFWAGENRKDIFHFDVHNNTDSLFLIDGVEFYQPFPNTGHVVSDFEFTDSTLTNFYQAGDAITSFEPGPIVIYNRNYDSPFQVNSFHGVTYNLEIANIDSSFKVFVYSDNTPKGIFTQFKGIFELVESTENFQLVSINSKNPKFWFVEDQKYFLYKSIDTGKTFHMVDSKNISRTYFTQDYLNRFFIYDPNNLNIYRIINYDNKYQLIVSNNFGELGSWTKTFESSDEIFISYDKSLSGTLYIAVGKQIYISTDYGYSFSLFTEIEQNILGIYKKTNSDLLYVTTKHKLLEINSDSLKTLKQLIDYNNLSYYPLNIGNKWYYEIIDDPVWEIGADKYILTKEVIKDTLLENGKKYFIIQETQSDTNQINLYFERIDSINGKVYRLVEEINNAEEFLIVDLYSAIGDSFQTFINITNFYETENVYLSEEKLQNIFKYDSSSQELTKNYIISTNDNLKFFDYSFAKNFGKTFQHKGHFDAYDEYQNLIAAFINGIKYGDTILVDIKNNKTILLTEFSLTQNYPNPFNPTTTIEYSIPSNSVMLNSFQHLNNSEIPKQVRDDNVKLIVYDVLGREVKTLVNKKQKPGIYKVEFDGSNLSSGVYLYQFKSGTFIQTKKMIILK